MRSMQWQLGMLGTVSAIVFRHRETEKNLCRGGRSQDLPNTDFWPVVRHIKEKQQYTHSTANTHQTTTIYTRQLQQYTRPNNNNYTQDNLKLATKQMRQFRTQNVQKGKNAQVKEYCLQFLVTFCQYQEMHNLCNVYFTLSGSYTFRPFAIFWELIVK